jgi:PPK2 family polyphosphate:nucleotide phosphotransferase
MADKAPSGADLADRLRIKPGSKVQLSKWDPNDSLGHDKESAQPVLVRGLASLDVLQDRLYASKAAGLLIVLQGMDTSGKDGTIKHVMTSFNAQGVEVSSFVAPSAEERAHDYLWRHHLRAPKRGWVGIHNRSHYESVLVERVENLTPAAVWRKRYAQINDWEQELTEAGTRVIKFFLHIDKDEQKVRLQARLDDPTKQWKFNPDDLKTRAKWDLYLAAYDDMLEKCSTEWAPWYVIPANRKWFRNLAVAEILIMVLESLKLQYPKPAYDPKAIVIE